MRKYLARTAFISTALLAGTASLTIQASEAPVRPVYEWISETGVDVHAANLFDGFELGGIGGGGRRDGSVIGDQDLQNIVARLPDGDRQLLKFRCRDILRTPAAFEADVIQLCLAIAIL